MARSPYTGVLLIRRSDIIKSRDVFDDFERRRVDAGIPIAVLCRAARTTRQAYHKWKRGEGGVMPETLEALKTALAALSDLEEAPPTKKPRHC